MFPVHAVISYYLSSAFQLIAEGSTDIIFGIKSFHFSTVHVLYVDPVFEIFYSFFGKQVNRSGVVRKCTIRTQFLIFITK